MTMPRIPHEPSATESAGLLAQALRGEAPLPENINFITAQSNLPRTVAILRQLREMLDSTIDSRLNYLKFYLVNAVREETPVASGRLRRSTHGRIIDVRREEQGQEPGLRFRFDSPPNLLGELPEFSEKVIQVLQDASPHRAVSRRYFYWYTVNRGTRPQGALTRVAPPAANLIPWLRRPSTLLGQHITDPTEEYETARYLSKIIYERGITPNPYIDRAQVKALPVIQAVTEDLEKTIHTQITTTLSLGQLPSIVDRGVTLELPGQRGYNPYTASMVETLDHARRPHIKVDPNDSSTPWLK